MRIHETEIAGVFIVEPELISDERGSFARTWSADAFGALGYATAVVQCNISHNHKAGTLRGMHWQAEPFEEYKLVRVTAGRIYDVAVDIRPGSPSYCHHISVELSAKNRLALAIPAGCAHGFQTLTDDAEVFYQMSQVYSAEHARSAHYRSPAFGITWPLPISAISARDAAAAAFE